MNGILKSLVPSIDFGWNRVRSRCASSSCHNKLLMRPVSQKASGIRVGQQWYCSVDCFVAGARSPLAALCARRVMDAPRNPRLPLGLALLARGLLSEDQLRLATARSQRDEDLEATLLSLGLVSEKQLATVRAAQWGCPVLNQERASKAVVADIPPTLLRTFAAAPLHYAPDTKRLVLGFAHRVDHSLLRAIEQMTGCHAEPCFITPAEVAEQMQLLAAPRDYEEVAVEEPGAPAQMARTLGRLAMEASVQEVDFAPCKAWVWARLLGRRRIIDVLFARQNVPAASPVADSFPMRKDLVPVG